MRIYINGDGIEGLARKLASLGDKARGAINDMLMQGSDYMIDALQQACTSYGHDRTGGLRESIQRKSAPKVTEDGGEVIITFKGANEYGTRYGEIMAYLNYGTSHIRGDHWVDNTVDLAKPLAEQIMSDVLDKHLAE